MANKNIGSLPGLDALSDDALLVVEQSGTAMKLTGAQFKAFAVAAIQQHSTAAQNSAQAAATNAQNAQNAATRADEAVTRYPRINSETGFWQIWNADTGAYADTGVKAQGPAGKNGNDGSDGNDGLDGATAFEGAQTGGYTGTEAEFYADLAALAGLAAEMDAI